MKPRTKIQIEVWRLCQKLHAPKNHEPFMKSKHAHYYTMHYKSMICLECNHKWKPELSQWKEEAAGVRCPSCKRELVETKYKANNTSKILTFSVVQVVDRFQVVRYFSCWKHLSKKKPPVYHFRALFEEWKDWDKGKTVIVGRIPTWTGDGFTSSSYEIRANSPRAYKSSDYNRFASDYNCPGAEFLPRFEKYGLTYDFHNCDYRALLRELQDPKIETLLKAKQAKLLTHAVYGSCDYSRYWPQVKMVIRHKYKLEDAGMWYDYLQLLQYFKRDIFNPKFVLPKNLKNAHNELVAKKQKKLDRERAIRERERQEMERAKAEAAERLRVVKADAFKNFKIKAGDLLIVPLIDEQDVKLEGEVLKHCVHTNEYHNKPGILLMSARINNERIETIEISLESFKIIQARGFDNEATEWHDEIVSAVNKKMREISKIVEKAIELHEADNELQKLENVA